MPKNSMRSLIERHMADARASWSLGTFGAIAEFMRDADEAVMLAREPNVTAITPRGGLRIDPDQPVRPIAHENATPNPDDWNHAVALCLPEAACAMNVRTVLTELGQDHEALRAEHRDGVLFDLGFGAPQVDVCVRSDDAAVIERLRAAVGCSLLDPDNPLMRDMPVLSPHRVFICRFGRIEVFQPIPTADGQSPEGPHTHVLPKLLKLGRTHAATTPIPDGWVPCMQLYPAHPTKDLLGRTRPFDRETHEGFQALFEAFGDPEFIALKRQVTDAVRSGREPHHLRLPKRRGMRAALRVALRQIARTEDCGPALRAWRAAFDPAPQKGPPDVP